jgi:uncharacterized metal-binding protein YceD (DUF177 family)
MSAPEFSRLVDVRQAQGRAMRVTASEAECAALARRFGLVAIGRLEAEVVLKRDDRTVNAAGRLVAGIVQGCAVSGEDLAVAIDEAIVFRFVPAATYRPDEEIELSAAELDEIEYQGDSFDLGEAVAQSLALAIDPFAVGPQAEAARRRAGLAGEGESGPFAALAALKRKN